MMVNKMRVIGSVCVVVLLAGYLHAGTLEDAFAWYKLDSGTVGSSVTTSQVVDSIDPAIETRSVGALPPVWADASGIVREGLATADDRALDMTNSDIGVKVAAKYEAKNATLQGELYGTYTASQLSGSLSMFVRVKVNDDAYSWDQPLRLISNYTRGIKRGVSFKLLGSSTSSNPHAMTVRPCITMADGSVQTTLYTNSLSVPIAEWVDVAFSYDADEGKVLMSTYDVANGFAAFEFDYSGLVAPGYDKAHFLLGSSLNASETGYEQRLPGCIESFALWNTALTTYELKALSMDAPDLLYGDANGDGMVSVGDCACIQSNFGNVGDPDMPGDANHDGVVSEEDFAAVQANYGAIAGSGSVLTPEPATLCLLIGGGLSLIRRRK